MIIIIGLEKLAKTFGLSVNQIAQELGIGRQTIYDWFKGKRKIPKERIEQLKKISEFNHVSKELFQKEIGELDALEIELAYFQHLSAEHSEELIDENGIPFILDPYSNDRVAVEMLRSRLAEMKDTKALLQSNDYMEGLLYPVGENYSQALAALNGIFQQEDVKKIKAVTNLLLLINRNDLKGELEKDLIDFTDKHDV